MNCSIGNWMEWDGDGIAFDYPSNYKVLGTKRSRKCLSCNEKIKPRDLCGEIRRFRSPRNDIEERICGDEVYLAPAYYCESCTDILFNLQDLGYDVGMIDMKEALEEYHELQKEKRHNSPG